MAKTTNKLDYQFLTAAGDAIARSQTINLNYEEGRARAERELKIAEIYADLHRSEVLAFNALLAAGRVSE